jgi:dipeptidyl aminopeptidase/acylaminoacyl peptidase
VWLRLACLALLAVGCTSLRPPSDVPARPPLRPVEPPASLPREEPPEELEVTPTARKTVEDSLLLDLYDWLRGDDYRAFTVAYRGVDGRACRAHLLLPPGPGPHPGVLVFPIRGGSYVVSEALAKALVLRGYAVLHFERRRLFEAGDPPGDFAAPAARLRDSVRDARRLLDWFAAHPEIDSRRIAAAGVSLGGILAATLMGLDERIQAGLFLLAGGGLPEILYESDDGPLQRFRERALAEAPEPSREWFLEAVRPHTRDLDPLTYAANLDPRRTLLVSGRFDRIVPPGRTAALWEALGRPEWIQLPTGHYEALPFLWWAAGRGADFLDRVLAAPAEMRRAEGEPARP